MFVEIRFAFRVGYRDILHEVRNGRSLEHLFFGILHQVLEFLRFVVFRFLGFEIEQILGDEFVQQRTSAFPGLELLLLFRRQRIDQIVQIRRVDIFAVNRGKWFLFHYFLLPAVSLTCYVPVAGYKYDSSITKRDAN